MLPLMAAFFASFMLVTIAEMADKTQLLTLCLTCRYPARQVLIGISLAIAVLNLGAVLVGDLAGRYLPVTPVKAVAGLIFVGFGVWTLLQRPGDDEEEVCETNPRRSPIAAVALAFFVAEMGDKTQLAVLSLSANYNAFLAVWAGASLGLLAANALAIGGGTLLGNRLPEQRVRRISGVLFIVFGMWTLTSLFLL